jgi:two-component system chemotaxis response regulator CheB
MGSDGARGAEVLRRGGAEVLAQDEASSVVWGMPGAVVGAGLAHRVLPLDQLAREITRVVSRGRSHALIGAAR